MSKLPTLAGLLLCSSCATPLTASLRLSDKPLALQAQLSTARLVFVRPDHFSGSAVSAYFVDASTRRVLGKSVNQTAFAVDVEPGTHLLCPVPVFDQALGRMSPATAPAMATRTPLTRVTVEAGRTYLIRVSVRWGPVIEAVPVRPDTTWEQEVLEALKTTRPVELAPQLDDLAGDELSEWIDRCRLSSSDDVRLAGQPADGRLTAAPAPL